MTQTSECTIILARHAATAANSRRPAFLQGSRRDYVLDELGSRQAQAIGNALAEIPFAAIYTSPLLRARQTAHWILAHHDRLEIIQEPRLIEVDVGQWEGLSWPVIQERWPVEYAAFQNDAERYGYLGGENLGQVRDRSLLAIEEAARRHAGSTIVIVGHNGVNRSLIAHWIGVPLRYARRIPQDNAGYNLVIWRDGVFHVRSINVAGHLAGLLPPE